VFVDLLRDSEGTLESIVGGAYWTLGYWPFSIGELFDGVNAGADGAEGAGRNGIIGDDTPPPGGRGAGRCGTNPAPLGGAETSPCDNPPVLLRGIGGGARGFSKLSCVLLGKRGLCGGLSGPCTADMCETMVGAVENPEEMDWTS
jgi:hypothetical protein